MKPNYLEFEQIKSDNDARIEAIKQELKELGVEVE